MAVRPSVPIDDPAPSPTRVPHAGTRSSVVLSVVIPVHNEEDNIRPLYDALSKSLVALGRSYEIILVDDGSRDETYRAARASVAAATHSSSSSGCAQLRPDGRDGGRLRPRARRRHRPDGRRPAERSRPTSRCCSTKLEEGYDVVSGWRQRPPGRRRAPAAVADRQLADRPRHRRAPARLRLHAQGLPRRDRRRRPASTARCTASSRRSPTRRARGSPRSRSATTRAYRGTSKYGLGRTFKVMLDLLTVKFLSV